MSTRKSGAPLWLLTAYALFCIWCSPARAESTAFYYGPDVPRELLAAYDQVVIEPSYVTDLAALAHSHAALVAYVSIAELAESDPRPIDPAWVIGRNNSWSTRIMDVAQPGYQRLLRDRIESLWRIGYRRFYLDALDSYALTTASTQLKAAQVQALSGFILELSQRHPDARLLLNRGFELLPQIARQVHGVVAESLFDGWDAAESAYVRVPEREGRRLYEHLREARDRYGLPVTVIDYRPPREREQARQTARKIVQIGFAPWVGGSHLNDIGVGELEILPRRVLIVSEEKAALQPGIARWLEPVLEYLGYVAEYATPSLLSAPGNNAPSLQGRYAGIISVLQKPEADAGYQTWLRAQLRAGVRVAIFGELGFALDSKLARELGIRPLQEPTPGALSPRPIEWSARDSLIGFEADPELHPLEGAPFTLDTATARHLELRLPNGEIATAVATAPWGGIARSHVLALRGLHGQRAWVLDPFAFLQSALALPLMPVPDVTTESGGRVAFFAIDVDGAGQHARTRGRPLVSEQLLELLSEQPWPHALAGADAAALQQLMSAPGVYADSIRTGTTTAHNPLASLTQVAPLYEVGATDPIAAPIAPDSGFLDGASESYAFARVLGAFAFTDSPRRISPIALQYHAYAAGSPGGVDALARVYDALSHTSLYVVRLAEYRARLRAFRQQVVARDLHGDFHVLGGEALRTLRVPTELGPIDLASSGSVAAVSTLPQGRYVTFAANGSRSLHFGAPSQFRPYLEQTNARIDHFSVSQQGVALAASAAEPLLLRFAGLPASTSCALRFQDQLQQARSDRYGRAAFALATINTGDASLLCPAP